MGNSRAGHMVGMQDKRLLICDDEPAFGRFVKIVAEDLDYEVKVTTTWQAVFVKAVVRRVHAASLILRAPVARSGFSQTSATGAQLRGCPDHRSGLAARAAAQRQARWASTV